MEVDSLDADQLALLDQLEHLELDDGGGSQPPHDPFDALVDEGPMRSELRRQIAALERALTRFVLANCPTEQVRTSATRGPGILTTAELEEIRDELLACRARLHDKIVQRTLGQQVDDAVQRKPRKRRGLRRRAGQED